MSDVLLERAEGSEVSILAGDARVRTTLNFKRKIVCSAVSSNFVNFADLELLQPRDNDVISERRTGSKVE